MPRQSISQGIDKVTFTFQFDFVGTFGLVTYLIHSTSSFHDRDFVLYSKSCCIIDTINERILYKNMCNPELP